MTMLPRRCAITGNPCGTDTEMIGHSCQCDMCIAWREIERLRAALGEIAREDHDEEAQPGPYSKIATAALEQSASGEVK